MSNAIALNVRGCKTKLVDGACSVVAGVLDIGGAVVKAPVELAGAVVGLFWGSDDVGDANGSNLTPTAVPSNSPSPAGAPALNGSSRMVSPAAIRNGSSTLLLAKDDSAVAVGVPALEREDVTPPISS
jgi:hypothetical protein